MRMFEASRHFENKSAQNWSRHFYVTAGSGAALVLGVFWIVQNHLGFFIASFLALRAAESWSELGGTRQVTDQRPQHEP